VANRNHITRVLLAINTIIKLDTPLYESVPAVEVTLLASAADCRAATPLLLSAGVQQSIDIYCPPGAQQQTRSS